MAKFQPRPMSELTKPADHAALRQPAQDKSHGGRYHGITKDGPDVLPGDAESVTNRRIAAIEPDHGRANQGRVGE